MGGAIFNMQGALSMTNSTLSGNAAIGGADLVSDHGKGIGGAVFNLNGGFTASSSTIASNSADYYAAQIFNIGYNAETPTKNRKALTTLKNSIVANGVGSVGGVQAADLATDTSTYITPANQATDEADVSQTNLVRTISTQVAAGETGHLTGSPLLTADPLLGPLAFNGGPGMATMSLAAGSPAVGVGSGCPATDERGVARSGCDLGAVQHEPPTVTTVVVSDETVSPRTFRSAKSGSSIASAKRRKPPIGAKVGYTLDNPATVVHGG